MLADRLAEGLTHLGVGDGLLERRIGNPHAARGNVDAAKLQTVEDLLQPASLDAADHAIRGDFVIVEAKLTGIDASVAELFELAVHRKAGPLLSDEEAHAL